MQAATIWIIVGVVVVGLIIWYLLSGSKKGQKPPMGSKGPGPSGPGKPGEGSSGPGSPPEGPPTPGSQ